MLNQVCDVGQLTSEQIWSMAPLEVQDFLLTFAYFSFFSVLMYFPSGLSSTITYIKLNMKRFFKLKMYVDFILRELVLLFT